MINPKKFAILGDIHANLEALEAVLEDCRERNVTDYACVGDVVGYNANPSECLEIIRELKCVVVRGNHDHYSSHGESLWDFHALAADVLDWTRHRLTDEQVEYLRNLRMSRMLAGFTLVHSTLDMPEKWGYVFEELEAAANFNYQSTGVCFHGHTHIPAVFERDGRVTRSTPIKLNVTLGKKYFINVGSVGQPRDGNPLASYVTYDMGRKEVEFRRIQYDIEKTQEKIRGAGLPEMLASRLAAGK